jgi:hypothetical protein
MTNTRKPKKVKGYNVKKELRKADLLFKSIAQDKSLPSFGSFFMLCMIMGTAENVNLKVMYPKVYKKCNIWLKEHREQILAMQE